MEDFNFQSLKENMDALVISPHEDRRQILVKLKPGNLQAGIALVKNAYNKVAPAYPFEYNFLDQKFDELYQKDIRQQTILTVFAGLPFLLPALVYLAWHHSLQQNVSKKLV